MAREAVDAARPGAERKSAPWARTEAAGICPRQQCVQDQGLPMEAEQAFKRCCQLCAPACMPSQIRSPDAHPAAGIAIGGDAFTGSTLSDHCLRYQHIPQVRLQVLRMCPVYAERRLGWVGSWLAGLAVPARAAGGAEGGQSLWCLQRMAGR